MKKINKILLPLAGTIAAVTPIVTMVSCSKIDINPEGAGIAEMTKGGTSFTFNFLSTSSIKDFELITGSADGIMEQTTFGTTNIIFVDNTHLQVTFENDAFASFEPKWYNFKVDLVLKRKNKTVFQQLFNNQLHVVEA